jgi:hypothetical protein
MKMRMASACAGMLLLIGALTAEAAGPLVQVGSWMSVGSPTHDLVIDGHHAYVVTDLGLKVVNLSNPAAPQVVGSINLGGKSFGVAFKSPHVYVANQTKDLQIIDVSIPASPVLVKTLILPGSAWDVAVKDDRATGGKLIAYVADYNGELRVIDISNPLFPQVIKVLGLPVWGNVPSKDAVMIAKLQNYVTSGNAKNTGVAVGGNFMAATDWNSGRLYFYDVTTAANPIYAGTHYVPFTFRVKINAEGTWAYTLAAYGYSSGIYSFPLSLLDPNDSTYHAQCPTCGFFAVTPTDYGGLGLTANARYVMSIAGKKGEIDVINACNPSNLLGHSFVPMPPHGARTAQSMGVAQYGDYVIAAGAVLGIGVFHFESLSNACPPPPQG